MVNKAFFFNKDNVGNRLEERILRLLKKKGALPVCAIKRILEERLNKKINRRRIYRKLDKMRRWDKVRKVTEKKVGYFGAKK